MRAKFGRGPTVVSKKGSLKFISRYRFIIIRHLLLTLMRPPFQHYLELAAEYPNEDDSNYEIIEG